jgi:hypothetical protein
MAKVSRRGRGAVVSIDVRTFAVGRAPQSGETQSRRNQDAQSRRNQEVLCGHQEAIRTFAISVGRALQSGARL